MMVWPTSPTSEPRVEREMDNFPYRHSHNAENHDAYDIPFGTGIFKLKMFLVITNAMVAAYALASSVFNGWLGFFINDWVLFVSDQVLAYLMVSSVAAVAEVLYLGYKGDEVVSWSEACTSYGRFCRQTLVSLVLHAVAFVCFLVLAIISAYRLFTKFEGPYISKEADDQVE
ncbi:hypothetical protein ACLOJK_039401 [Asimina triloba]